MRKEKNQRGYTMTELMLVLGVGAMILGGAYAGYNAVSSDASYQQTTTSALHLASGVKNLWGTTGSYTGLTTTKVINANLVPKPLTSNTTRIFHPYGDQVSFSLLSTSGAATTVNYLITFSNIPKGFCLTLAPALDAVAFDIRIGGTDATDAVKTTSTKFDGSSAIDKCSLASSTSVYAYIM